MFWNVGYQHGAEKISMSIMKVIKITKVDLIEKET